MSVSEIISEINEIRAAEAAVAPYVRGQIMAADSADAVYRKALKQLGYREKVHQGAARAMFTLLKDPAAVDLSGLRHLDLR